MTDSPTQRWKGVCSYDGTDFEGWQSQPNGNTIQDVIEARLGEIFKKPLRIHGSARTDSGVHAKYQVFHFEILFVRLRHQVSLLKTPHQEHPEKKHTHKEK